MNETISTIKEDFFMLDFLMEGGGLAPVCFYMVPPLLKKNQKAFFKKKSKSRDRITEGRKTLNDI